MEALCAIYNGTPFTVAKNFASSRIRTQAAKWEEIIMRVRVK